MIKIITTVGTSIFTNYQKPKVRVALGRDYASIDSPFSHTSETRDGVEIPASAIYDDNYQTYITSLRENIIDFWYEYPNVGELNKNASAEISSILKIAAQEKEACEIHLVATDTLQSVLAAELIVGWFDKFPQNNVSKVLFQKQDTIFNEQKDSDYVVKDLRLRSQQNYRAGFMNLIELLVRISIKERTRLNITGGFKGIIPIVTLFSQLFEIPVRYLYEEDRESTQENLIKLENLPFHFDLGYIENYVLYLEQPDKLEENGNINRKKILEMYQLGLLDSQDSPVKLSIIGKLIKNKLESEDLPFHKTILGYLVEYKLYEYYNSEKFKELGKLTLGYKLTDNPKKDLEDADLWFENEDEIIIAEIKPAGFDKKRMRKKVIKIFEYLPALTEKKVKEFWVILYSLEENFDAEEWAGRVFSEDFLLSFKDIKFCVKTIQIKSNVIDGDRNRIRYHEFLRSSLGEVNNICEKKYQK